MLTALFLAVLPFLPLSPNGPWSPVAHPLVSLLLLAVLFFLIARAFRRKPN